MQRTLSFILRSQLKCRVVQSHSKRFSSLTSGEFSERTERHNLRSRQLRAEIETTMGMRQAVDPLMPPVDPLEPLPFASLPKNFCALDGTIIPCIESVVSSGTSSSVASKPSLTLLLTHTNDAGRKSLELFRKPFTEKFVGNQKVQTFELSLQSGWLRNLMSPALETFMKNVVPNSLHSNAALVTGETFRYEQSLGMTDRMLGYAYLVDARGIVWWSARSSKDFNEMVGGRVIEDMLSWSAACLEASINEEMHKKNKE